MWSISHHRGYCSRESTVQPPTPVAQVAVLGCLAGDPLVDCVPARLSPVVSMAPGDVCHAPRCSLGGLGPAALEYRSCYWPGGSAWSPQCVGVCFFVLCPSAALGASLCVVSLAPWRLFTGVRVLCVLCVGSVATWRLFTGVRVVCGMRVVLVASLGSPSPFSFLFFALLFVCCFFFFFLFKREEKRRGHANTIGPGMGR